MPNKNLRVIIANGVLQSNLYKVTKYAFVATEVKIMPNIKSAIKRQKTAKVKSERNKQNVQS